MNLFKFYEQLEFAMQFGLDLSSIPNNEIKELFDNLNNLIETARGNEKLEEVSSNPLNGIVNYQAALRPGETVVPLKP